MISVESLADLGINLKTLIAGTAGGVVRGLMEIYRKLSRKQRISLTDLVNVGTSGVVGGITATYLGDTVGQLLGANPLTAGFVTGLLGMFLCQMVVDQVVKRFQIAPTDTP